MPRIRLLSAGLVVLALHAVLTFAVPASGTGGVRFWGVHFLRFLPPMVAVLAYALTIAGLAAIAVRGVAAEPARAEPARAETAKAETAKPMRRRPRLPDRLVPLLVTIAAVGVFALLRARWSLLGDNMLRVQQAIEGRAPANEFGTMKLVSALVRLAGAHSLLEARRVFVGVSFAAGVIYVAGAWGATRVLRKEHATLLLAGLLCAGVVELFCGYVEVYPLVLAVLMVAVWRAVAAARGEGAVFEPVLLLAVAVFLHRVAVLWAPAALIPLWIRGREVRPGVARGSTFALVAAGALAGLVLGGRTAVLLPAASAQGGYTLFSSAHVSDYFNAQFLGCAAGFLLAPFALVRFARGSRVEAQDWVLLLAWLPPAVALFFFRPLLGAADWDLLALASPFAILFAGSVLLPELSGPSIPARSLSPKPARTSSTPAWVAAAVLLAACETVPWLALQASKGSIAWTRALISSDRADYFHTHPAPLHLAALFAGNGLPALQEEELEQGALEYPKDPRFAYNLAVIARARGAWERAQEQAEAAFRIAPGYPAPLGVLYDAYKAQGKRPEQALAGQAILEMWDNDRASAARYFEPARIEAIRREVATLPAE